jgi:hypothetical protein
LSRSRSRNVGDVLHATPLGRYQEQSSVADTPEHASEAAAVKLDGLQHFPAFANAHATLVWDIAIPNGVFGVEANAIGDAAVEVGPNPPVRKAAVSRDVEGRESLAVGLG